MKLTKTILCGLYKHKIADADLNKPGEIRCERCDELLSWIAEPEPLPNDKTFTNGCLGKTRFDSYQQAEERMARMKERPATLHPYECEHCGGFHLGNHRPPHKQWK